MILPAAAPTIMTGMRISIGIAWLVIVAAEMLVGGTGIGYFVWNEWNNLSIANIVTAILLIGVVGLLLDQGLARLTQARDLSGVGAAVERPLISVEGLARRFGDGAPAGGVREFGSASTRGEFVCLIGHSGCGKTTILNVLAGLDQPSDGAVIVDSREIDGPSLDRAVIFQGHALMPWLSVMGNIAFAVSSRWPRGRRARSHDHARKFIELVGLDGAERKKPVAALGRHEAARRHRPRASHPSPRCC